MSVQVDAALIEAELRLRLANARDPYDQAVWHLLLGEPAVGLAVIGRAIPDLSARATASSVLHAAELALLAGHPDAPGLAAAAVRDGLSSYVADYRAYLAAMLSLASGDDVTAREQQSALEGLLAGRSAFRSGHPVQLAGVPAGLLAGDAKAVTAAVEALLAWHLRRARTRSDIFNSSRGVISRQALVAILLAAQRKLPVSVSPQYRVARIPMLAIYLTEWGGRPLPRALPYEITTDLVAGAWLRARGVPMDDARAERPWQTRPARSRTSTTPPSEAEAAVARQALQRRIGLPATPWQLASWALMLGDVSAAREHLRAGAADASRRWQGSAPPNQNVVREHFGLALVLADESGIRESSIRLQAWLRTQEGRTPSVYAHAWGYLDLICDLIGGGDRARPSRTAVEAVGGLYPSTRVAAIGLAERDPDLFRTGLDGILADHAKALARKSSPPAPLAEPAVHLAVAARRLGLPVSVDERYGAWPVPIEGGRLPCDLLGVALWSAQN